MTILKIYKIWEQTALPKLVKVQKVGAHLRYKLIFLIMNKKTHQKYILKTIVFGRITIH